MAGSTTSPLALTATRAATTAPFGRRIEAVPIPPFMAAAAPNILPTVAPVPAPDAALGHRTRRGGASGLVARGRVGPDLPVAEAEIEQDRGRHDRHLPDADREADPLLFQVAHDPGRGVEAEGRAAGEQDGVDLLDAVHGVEKIGLARARGPSPHVHAADGPGLGHHHRAARRPPRVGEVADAQPGNVGQAPGLMPREGRLLRRPAALSGARERRARPPRAPQASAVEKPRRSISLMKPPGSMLAPRRHARASTVPSLCQISVQILNLTTSRVSVDPPAQAARPGQAAPGHPVGTDESATSLRKGMGSIMKIRKTMLAAAAVAALVPVAASAEGIEGRWSVSLQGGTDIELSGERPRRRVGNRARAAHQRRGQVLQRRLRPELPRSGVDRVRHRAEERGLRPRVVLQDELRDAAGRNRRRTGPERRLRRLQGVGRRARLPLLLQGRPALQALPRPGGGAALRQRAALDLQRASRRCRPERRALLRELHGGRLRRRPGLRLRSQRRVWRSGSRPAFATRRA